ncbi:hypothetical protein FFA01_28560 [Frigoribacterium faeni]|uniref:Uncharacterized protein n=1 Tax=Frigoribacterium faeni TaxID=145483 RepID=A0ABQ0USV1_9MICO|nr:hypothetical protein GCM10025699_72230 [Microbacterium flavescens]GEK84547.1 hypothetical protein FFA01_28560 [Frigoribacterium faeni]
MLRTRGSAKGFGDISVGPVSGGGRRERGLGSLEHVDLIRRLAEEYPLDAVPVRCAPDPHRASSA